MIVAAALWRIGHTVRRYARLLLAPASLLTALWHPCDRHNMGHLFSCTGGTGHASTWILRVRFCLHFDAEHSSQWFHRQVTGARRFESPFWCCLDASRKAWESGVSEIGWKPVSCGNAQTNARKTTKALTWARRDEPLRSRVREVLWYYR